LQIKHNFVKATFGDAFVERAIPQNHRSTKRRMSTERDLLSGHENARLNSLLLLDRNVSREDEGGLLQVGFAGQILHFGVAESTRVRENGQRVPLQAMGSKDIDLKKLVAPIILFFAAVVRLKSDVRRRK